jgi:hypothetical protein
VARSDGHRALTRGADRLLAPCPADPPLALPWAEHETMKQVIEAAGVPHPEIAALCVNGAAGDFT